MNLHTSKGRRRLAALAFAAAVAGCGLSGDGDPATEAAALAHAQANPELRQNLDALGRAGWAAEAASKPERFQPPADAATAGAAPSTWTRVRFPMLLRAAADRPETRADLVVAWPEKGADVFAIAPRDAAAAKSLLDALPGVGTEPAPEDDGTTLEDPSPAEIESTSAALTCGRGIGETCSSSVRCCRGLACTAYSYYSTCSCGTQYTIQYPERATTSVACFNLWDNPIGAAKIQRYRRGCAAGNGWDLTANACGNAVSVPAFQTSTWTQLICLFTPGPIC